MTLTRRLLSALTCLVLWYLSACAQQNPDMSKPGKTDHSFTVHKTDEEWKKTLSNEQYYVLREKGTERPYSGKLLMHKEKGNYTCAGCGNILFSSDAKFDSHCGWPSFDKQVDAKAVVMQRDSSHGMVREEILCGKCGGHLGHIFDDGPTATGQRYCVNSLSLSFEPMISNDLKAPLPSTDTLTLGGGCFWCIEAIFADLKGVTKVESGYSGGSTPTTTYKEVCTGTTGHAEVVQVSFDPSVISAAEILKVFFTVHDPTTLNRQGGDVGTQYRSVIFYRDETQKALAEKIIAALKTEKAYDAPIVTEIAAFKKFIKAEDYHQNYYKDNQNQPYCKMVIKPKMEKFEKVFKELRK